MTDPQNFVASLDEMAVINVTGPQAKEYLQGQLTIDLDRVNETNARFGAHCDFKGKTWSVFTIVSVAGGYELIMPKECIDKSLPELKKYGVFSKVEINDAPSHPNFIGLSGSDNIALAKNLFPELAIDHLSKVENANGIAICINLSTPKILLMLSHSGFEHFTAVIKESSSPGLMSAAGQNDWNFAMIADGIASLSSATSNEFVPQMLNLQLLAGIDFDKGCYMGQETVARTKFLGRNKRATYLLSGNTNSHFPFIANGAALEKQVGENWRSGGTLLQAATRSANTDNVLALAVLSNDTDLGSVLRLKEHPEQSFTVEALPYTLDE